MTRAACKVHELFDAGNMSGVWDMIEERRSVGPNAPDKDGKTMLHKAIYDRTLVKALIEAGADPNISVRGV